MAAEIAPGDSLFYYSYFLFLFLFLYDHLISWIASHMTIARHSSSSCSSESANGGSSCLSCLYMSCIFNNATWYESRSKKGFQKSPTPLDFRPSHAAHGFVFLFFFSFSFWGGRGHKRDGVGFLWNLFLCLLSRKRRLEYLSRKAFS